MRKNIFTLFLILTFLFLSTACGTQESPSGSSKPKIEKLESINLIVDEEIAINNSKSIKVEFEPSDKEEEIIWESSNEEIATVVDGEVKGIGLGNVQITATTTSGISKSVAITIYQPVETFKISKKAVDLYVGEKEELKVTITPTDATYNEVKWDSSNSSVAEVSDSGVITGKVPGNATITGTTDEGLTVYCEVTVKDKPIKFSGSGNKVISDISLPNGVYKAVLSNKGSSNFIVKFYPDSSDDYDLLANEIGNYNGAILVRDGSPYSTNGGMLEIKSKGKWTITFEKVSGTISSPYTGKGDVVSGYFIGTGGRSVVKLTNKGKSNFIVKIYDEYGDYDLLANEIGNFSGETVFTTTNGVKYYFEITSSGSWSITW